MAKMQTIMVVLGLLLLDALAEILVRKYSSSGEVDADGNVKGVHDATDSTKVLSPSLLRNTQEDRMEVNAVGKVEISTDTVDKPMSAATEYQTGVAHRISISTLGSLSNHRNFQTRGTTMPLSSAIDQYAAGVVRGVRQSNTRSMNGKTGHSRRGVLCYALTRSPAEDTVPLLAQQFARGCNAHFFFSHEHQQIGNVTILKAYSDAELQRGWAGQMHYMVIAGVFSKLAEMGHLQNYAWYIKVDTDTFVRSTLRAGLERYTSDRRLIVAPIGLTNTLSDGYFIALAGTLMNDLLQVGQQSSMCDEVASGHNNLKDSATMETNLPHSHLDCIRSLDIQMEPFLDVQNRSLMFLDTGDQDCDMFSPEISRRLIDHFSHTRAEMCECRSHPKGYEGPIWCYSPDFAIVHAVKDPLKYRQLMDALP